MKLKDHLNGLLKLAEENSALLECEVITSKDDEGNGYNRVFYSPSTGRFDGEDFDTDEEAKKNPNVVCLN